MILLKLNESNASLRVVPLPSLISASNGTSAATNESGRTFYFSIGGVDYGSGGSISAVSAVMGIYTCNFSASKISVSGPGMVYYGGPNSSATALPVSAPFMVVPVDSYDSMRYGLFALPNAAAEASGGIITRGTGTGQLHVSSGSVGILAQTHSGVTIKGIENYANISNVTLAAGTHSNVTIQGVTRVNSGVTLNADTHSGATIQGLTRALNLSANGDKTGYSISGTKTTLDALNDIDGSGVTLHAGTHSNVTIQGVTRALNLSANGDKTGYGLADGAITSAKFGAAAIDAAALATDAGQEIADRLIARNIEGGSDTGRNVGDALAVLRNKAAIDGSTLTVYGVDDSTSRWTATVTTGSDPISGVDPA
jgi:hypothetical protein